MSSPETVSPHMLRELGVWISQKLGWNIDMNGPFIEKRLAQVCTALGFPHPPACIHALVKNELGDKGIQAVAREFSVGESYFFRDANFFNHLEKHIIPEIMQNKRRQLAIWSVGCSSGEEVYSIAMLLQEKIPDLNTWCLDILGTDVNMDALEKAQKGVFGKWSFRETPRLSQKHFFSSRGNFFEIVPTVKDMVRFKYHNIAALTMPDSRCAETFDLILIRNVLIYFEEQKTKAIVSNLFSRLNPGGWLVTTPVEYSAELFSFDQPTDVLNGSIIRKRERLESSFAMDTLLPEDVNDLLSEEIFTSPLPQGDLNDEKTIRKEGQEKSVPDTQHLYHYQKALKMLESGENKNAKDHLRQCLYLESSCVLAHIVLGNILKKEGEPEKALRHIARAKELLQAKAPEEEITLSDGLTANDLLEMITTLQEVPNG